MVDLENSGIIYMMTGFHKWTYLGMNGYRMRSKVTYAFVLIVLPEALLKTFI